MTSGGLEGCAAIVTGASRGIGLATAAALVEAGAHVVVTARTQERADAAAGEIGPAAVGRCAHAADEQAARETVEFVIERFGRLDLLVNNAGTNPAAGALADIEHARFAKTVDVNVWAPVVWTREAARGWMSEHGGSVVNVASVGAYLVASNIGVYNASKATLIYLTRQLAFELAPSVRVNAVAPGLTRTRLAEALWKDREAELAAETPLGRLGEPEDVASAVRFLLGEEASYITGETLTIDGGQLLGGRAESLG